MEKSNVSMRITKIIANEAVSVRHFEKIIGCSNGLIQKCISRSSDINSVWLSNIAEKYPQYNAEWILTGKGDMLRKHNADEGDVNEPAGEDGQSRDKEIYRLQRECYDKSNKIIQLMEDIAILRKELEEIKRATE